MPENAQIEPRFYEFGDYSLDSKERVLRREGESLFLPPKVFDTLLALVRQSGHLVERDSLLEEVWADTFVEEANLTVNISALRKVLGTKENGKPFIETVPRRGYRFAADVTELPDDAEIVVRRTRAKISITTEEEPRTLQETNPISKSLAVLPFQMLGGDPNAKFLGLGLADALIMQLGRQQQMLVRPTSAIREFADASRSSIEIGRKLEVGAVLEGSFQVFNERLRLTVQLFDVEKSSSLWSETFNVHFTDIFEVQDEISKRIADLLLLKLTGEERSRLSKQDTRSGEAYLEYLKGRYFWDKRDIPGFRKAIGHFQKAIDFDPTYALAYSGLADVYCLLGVWGEISPHEIFPRARAAAQRALKIDAGLAEAHASLGQVKYIYDWDWTGAEKCYRQAMQLNSNYATVHGWLAKIYTITHRFEEALNELKLAQNLDPLSLQFGASTGAVYLYSRQYDECIEQLNKVLEINPDFVPALITLGNAFAQKGMFDEAIKPHEKATELSNNHLVIQGFLAGTLALFGEREKALEIVEKLKQNLSENKSLTYSIAAIYARLNEKDESLAWLERAFQEHDCNLPGISMEVEFDNLRGDARFDEMLRRLGLYGQTIGEKTNFLQVKAETTALAALSETKTLAVLPFFTSGLQPEEEYLGLGLADALITQLSRAKQFAVRPTSSVRGFTNSEQSVFVIGQKLNVGSILEGSVQRAGERMRVTVQLVDTSSENSLWAEKFLFNFTDILEVQDEIASQVAHSLLRNLKGSEQKLLTKHGNINPEAHQLYLKGRFYFHKRDPEGLQKAIQLFEQAVRLAPDYAQAYAGLAESYIIGSYFFSPKELLPKAREAAEKAIELDPNSAEARVSLGNVKRGYDWDWQGAERDYRRALELNPNNVMAHYWYGLLHSLLRREDEAVAEMKKALELDPLSVPVYAYLGMVYLNAGKPDLAFEYILQALELDPYYLPGIGFLGQTFLKKDDFARAIAEFERQRQIQPAPIALANLAHAYSSGGQEKKARKILEQMCEQSKKHHVSPIYFALVYLGLNEREKMWNNLEKSFQERDVLLPPWLNTDIRFQVLRGEPRFQDLLRRIGF